MLLENVRLPLHEFDAQTLAVLRLNRIKLVKDLLATDSEKIARLCRKCDDLKTLRQVNDVKKKLFRHFCPPVENALELLEREAKRHVLKTGIPDLDRLLNGGFHSGKLYEMYGAPGSGRSQMAMFLTVLNGESEHNTLYVDTKNDFCVRRLTQMATERMGCVGGDGGGGGVRAKRVHRSDRDREEILRSFLVRSKLAKVFSLSLLLDVIYSIGDSLKQPPTEEFFPKVGLIVIDNIATLVMPLLGDSECSFQDISGYLSCLSAVLSQLANQHNLIVFVVNNSTNADIYSTPSLKPALGKLMEHLADERILLERTAVAKEEAIQSTVRKITIVRKHRSLRPVSPETLHSCLLDLTVRGFESI